MMMVVIMITMMKCVGKGRREETTSNILDKKLIKWRFQCHVLGI